MSVVIAVPELIAEAATDLARLGSTVDAAHVTSAASTVAVIPAAADEVSANIARLFSQQAAEYQALARQATAFRDQFVQRLAASAVSFTSAEAANVSLLLTPLSTAASSIPTALDSSVVLQLLGEIAQRFSFVIGNLPTALNALMQTFLVNPVYAIEDGLFEVGVIFPAFVLAPLAPLTVLAFAAAYTSLMAVPGFGAIVQTLTQLALPLFVSPTGALTPLGTLVAIPLVVLYLELFVYYATAGVGA